jgi:hypothetical protein
VRPTGSFRDRAWLSLWLVQRFESAIGVGLENPGIFGEMLLRMRAGPIRRVEEHCSRWIGAGKRPVVANIGPQSPQAGLHLGQHRHGGVVAMDPLGGEHVGLDQLVERQQRRRTGADMIGHGRDRQFDAFARKLLALPIERLMIGVFVHQDHRQQARPREASRDHMEGRRRLADLLAGAAAELLAHMLGHKQLPRHHVERLGDILADLRELAAAAAWARGRRRVNDAPARQVIGEVPARAVLPRKASNLGAGCLGLGRILCGGRCQFLQLQLQLIEQPLATLGARTEQLALHLGDHQLKVLDQRLGAG